MAKVKFRSRDLPKNLRVRSASVLEIPPEVKIETRLIEVPIEKIVNRTVEKIVEVPGKPAEVPVVDYLFTVKRDVNFKVQGIDVKATEQAPMKNRAGKSPVIMDYEIKVGERDGLDLIKTVTAVAKPRPQSLGLPKH